MRVTLRAGCSSFYTQGIWSGGSGRFYEKLASLVSERVPHSSEVHFLVKESRELAERRFQSPFDRIRS